MSAWIITFPEDARDDFMSDFAAVLRKRRRGAGCALGRISAPNDFPGLDINQAARDPYAGIGFAADTILLHSVTMPITTPCAPSILATSTARAYDRPAKREFHLAQHVRRLAALNQGISFCPQQFGYDHIGHGRCDQCGRSTEEEGGRGYRSEIYVGGRLCLEEVGVSSRRCARD